MQCFTYLSDENIHLDPMWGAWVAQVGKRLTSAQIMISWIMGWSPMSGSMLTAQSLDGGCFRLCVSLSLCPSPTRVCTRTLSKINKH